MWLLMVQTCHMHMYTCVFAIAGNSQRETRTSLLKELALEALSRSVALKIDQSSHWQREMNTTRFNLAPRGYGRSSYRVAEIVQMGRIPVVLFNDVAWLPYDHTALDFRQFGLVGKAGQMGVLMKQIVEMSAEEEARRLQRVKEVRQWYTYAGVLEQIRLFLLHPLSESEGEGEGGGEGGYLRCIRVPDLFLGHRRFVSAAMKEEKRHRDMEIKLEQKRVKENNLLIAKENRRGKTTSFSASMNSRGRQPFL